MLIGVAGIALLAFLASSIFLAPTSLLPKLVYGLALVLTLAQVALGFRLLASPDTMLEMAHEGLALLILILLGVGGMMAARARRMAKS